MDTKQLNFVMDKLGFTGNRRQCATDIIINGVSAYAAESTHNVPKGTANRDAIKCSKKWGEMLKDAKEVMSLI